MIDRTAVAISARGGFYIRFEDAGLAERWPGADHVI